MLVAGSPYTICIPCSAVRVMGSELKYCPAVVPSAQRDQPITPPSVPVSSDWLVPRSGDSTGLLTQTYLLSVPSASVVVVPLLRERSEERRVGKECDGQCRPRWAAYH